MSKAKKQLLVTFDYELSLGPNSGTAQNCILKPTNQLLKILEKNNVKAIFFVDTTYLLILKQYAENYEACAADFNAIANQIKEIAQNHYVYLHIHPHWLDAIYDPKKNTWNLTNIDHYALANLKVEQSNLLLQNCYNLLHSIIENCNNNKIEGYRAGGLFVQPFTQIKQFCINNNILHEFSVMKNFKSRTPLFEVDFCNAPKKNIYKFENDVCVEVNDGMFVQYSIPEFSMFGLNRIINSIYFRWQNANANSKAFGDGKGATHVLMNNEKKVGIAGVVIESFSVELMNNWKNQLYLKYLQKNSYLHFLSHPKFVSNNSLQAFDSFLKQCNNKFDITTNYKMFTY